MTILMHIFITILSIVSFAFLLSWIVDNPTPAAWVTSGAVGCLAGMYLSSIYDFGKSSEESEKSE